MSRVDQALRQAAPAVLPPAADSLEPPRGGHSPQPLDLYPSEPALEGGAAPFDVSIRAPVPVPERRRTFDSAARQAFRSPHADKLVTGGKLPASAVEQYRRLAATLHHLQEEQNLRTVTVTSAVPQEGKTLTIVNLALTLSGSYHRPVLLLHPGLRRPAAPHGVRTADAPGT